MAFLQDFANLKNRFPRKAQVEINTENCDYGDHIYDCKNGYYVFDSTDSNECMYVYDCYKESNGIDSLWNGFCEHCIEVSDSGESSNSAFCQYLGQCYNMFYSFNCGSCHDCFGCYNLGNKEYCIFNVQHTEEEYFAKLPELKKMPQEEIFAKVKEIELKFPKIQSYFSDNNNSEYVDYVYKSNAAYYCFDCMSLDECLYLNNSSESANTIDGSYIHKVENSIEAVDSAECFNCYNVQDCNRCYDSFFLFNCNDCNNCFGCANLNHKQYCILNIQYSKEEYFEKLKELKSELGLRFSEPVAAK